MSTDGTCTAICCGLCCTTLFSALAPWCNTTRCGCCNSNNNAGCCGPCFSESFDSDPFDESSSAVKPKNAKQPEENKKMVVPASTELGSASE